MSNTKNEALEHIQKVIRKRTQSHLQAVIKSFEFALNDTKAVLMEQQLQKRSGHRQIINPVKEVDLLRILRSPAFLVQMVKDLQEFPPEVNIETHFKFLTHLYKITKYQTLGQTEQNFLRSTAKAVAHAYDENDVFRNNFDDVMLIYRLALANTRFEFRQINGRIGELLLVANIQGRGTAKYRIRQNIETAIEHIFNNTTIPFEELYESTPHVPKPQSRRLQLDVKKYLFIKVLAHNPDNDLNEALQILTQLLGEKNIKTLRKNDLREFLGLKESKDNHKLINQLIDYPEKTMMQELERIFQIKNV
jgi:hypothetical protein